MCHVCTLRQKYTFPPFHTRGRGSCHRGHSPGVPPNTCPYIDMAKTIMDDMAAAYERLYEKGEHQPKFDDMKQLVDDQLEYIRRANECLRDNSAYWYNKYKDTL